MPDFEKIPTRVVAVNFTEVVNDPTRTNADLIVSWIKSFGGHAYAKNGYLHITTTEGMMRANEGDWIIKGVEDEFYPCKPSVFAKTYRPI